MLHLRYRATGWKSASTTTPSLRRWGVGKRADRFRPCWQIFVEPEPTPEPANTPQTLRSGSASQQGRASADGHWTRSLRAGLGFVGVKFRRRRIGLRAASRRGDRRGVVGRRGDRLALNGDLTLQQLRLRHQPVQRSRVEGGNWTTTGSSSETGQVWGSLVSVSLGIERRMMIDCGNW